MKKLSLFLFLTFLAAPVYESRDTTFDNAIVNKVISIYDGNTFRASFVKYPKFGPLGIQIADIDTPKLPGKCAIQTEKAQKAKQFTVKALRNAAKIELRNPKNGNVRIIAQVYVDGINLGDALIHAGHAVQYHGDKKTKDWCK